MTANNQIVVIGRAGKDAAPELRRLQSGESCVVTISLAVNRPGRDTKTDWLPVQFWNKNATRFAEFVKKGNLLSVTGSMRIETWDSNGETRQRAYIHGESFQMLESKSAQKPRNVGYSDFKESNPNSNVSVRALPKDDYVDEFALDDDELPPF
jgi:single-strand DNA-binding protein